MAHIGYIFAPHARNMGMHILQPSRFGAIY